MNTNELHNNIQKKLTRFSRLSPPEAIAEFAAIPEDDTYLYHFSWGLYLRSEVLRPGCRLYELFVATGIDHADDMSAYMLRKWHKTLSTEIK